MTFTISKKDYGYEVLLRIFNDWKLCNTSIELSNNLHMTNSELQLLQYEMLNENKAITPNMAQIPITDYNVFLLTDSVSKYGVLNFLKQKKMEFAHYIVVIDENEGIEVGRFDMLSNKIFMGKIIKLFPFPIIKYLIFHELLHVLGLNHGRIFDSIIARFPNKYNIELYLIDFVKHYKTHYIVKFKQKYYFGIRKRQIQSSANK
ncbi:hypothetical protein LCGC14_1306140 [marine sediment metagenome]|uniref:DUF45 domain-containing protein n=1 Tax=marine sediment metagenome TaxID=412755 RepID=A0A0F9KNN5_9ZZZZ|nr:DUF45 domain-containing protein [bacterium]